MLQDKDKELASRDNALPGLNVLLDSTRLQDRLRLLPQFAGLRTLTIDYLRYKPATSCLATLVLVLADGKTCHLSAKALTGERFTVSWQHPKRQRLVARQDPLAPIALTELAIILSYPQHDRGLPHLWLLDATPDRDTLIRSWLPETGDAAIDVKILRYKPERRLLALLICNNRPFATLRFASAERYDAMLTGNTLGQASGQIDLLAALPDYRLLIVRWIEGDTLCPEQGGNLPEKAVFQMGGRLASVHARPVSAVSPASNGIKEAWRVLNTLRVVAPQQESLFISLLSKLENILANDIFSAALIHGDFTLDQVVRTGDGQLQLIDWDRARTGNPAADLATFQARLELQVIEKTLSSHQVRAALAALHAGYRQQRGDFPRHLTAHVALALMQLAVEPFRKRALNWPQQIAALLQRADQLITDEAAKEAVVPEPALSVLMDKTRIADSLRQALALPASASLTAITLLTCKPGRRAVLEYGWETARGKFAVIGKYRHKGIGLHGFTVQQALWRSGLGENGEVIVPKPLATLAEKNLWLQQKVTGKRVTDELIANSRRLAETGHLVGQALAKLQHSPDAQQAVAGKQWTISDELRVLRQRLAQAAAARPAWASRISSVSKGCERLAASLTDSASRFLHRDFYPAQLLLPDDKPGQLAVLDFDLAASGPAALDAGNYVAHIREQALRDYGDVKALTMHEDAFIAAWIAESEASDIASIGLFTTLALARHIAISLLFPERHGTTEALIALCEARLAFFAKGSR